MNVPRRFRVLAGILAASVVAGAGVGLVVAGSMLLPRIGHIRPQFLWDLMKLGGQTGAVVGVLLGPPTILAFLRRVPLGRLSREVLVGVTTGGLTGVALSLTLAQPRPTISLILAGSTVGLAGSTVGLALTASRLWAQFREAPRPTSATAAG